jgi:GntR family transcriptional regulator, transcriptional repressor for pyruvate dehydrogenase complex
MLDGQFAAGGGDGRGGGHVSDRRPQLDLQPVQRRRAYEEVVERIQREILAGRLKVGDRLPGERQLSDRLGVSRASVREAMRVLEQLSIIRARTGTGPESGSIVVSEVGDAFSDALLMHTALDKISLDEVIDVRCMIESYAVKAAVAQDSLDLDPAREALDQLTGDDLGPEDYLKLDAAFHLAICEASGNRLVAHLMGSIREVVHLTLGRIFPSASDWASMRAEVTREHVEILEALEAGDGDKAAELVSAHIMRSHERLRS